MTWPTPSSPRSTPAACGQVAAVAPPSGSASPAVPVRHCRSGSFVVRPPRERPIPLSLSPPLCARRVGGGSLQIVLSMRMYSKSGSALNSLKRRSQTPAITHRRNRACTPVHFPNSGGRSRQGEAVRASQSNRIHKEPVVGAAPPRQPARPEDAPRSAPIGAVRSCSSAQDRPPFSILNQNSPHFGIPRLQTGARAPFSPAGVCFAGGRGRH